MITTTAGGTTMAQNTVAAALVEGGRTSRLALVLAAPLLLLGGLMVALEVFGERDPFRLSIFAVLVGGVAFWMWPIRTPGAFLLRQLVTLLVLWSVVITFAITFPM